MERCAEWRARGRVPPSLRRRLSPRICWPRPRLFPSLPAKPAGALKTCLRVAAPLASPLSRVEDDAAAEPAGPPSFNFGVEPPHPAWAEVGGGDSCVVGVGELGSAVCVCGGVIPNATSGAQGLAREEGRQVGARLKSEEHLPGLWVTHPSQPSLPLRVVVPSPSLPPPPRVPQGNAFLVLHPSGDAGDG